MFISGTYFSDNHWFSLLYGNFRFLYVLARSHIVFKLINDKHRIVLVFVFLDPQTDITIGDEDRTTSQHNNYGCLRENRKL